MSTQSHSGASYFIQGFSLITTKGLRQFVILPLLVNIVLFSIAFYFILLQLEQMFSYILHSLPSWLSWLDVILWPLAIVCVLIIFSFIFTGVANWIAAPFNGILAEKVEAHLTGQTQTATPADQIIKDIPHALNREWQKLTYYVPKAIGFLLLFFVPVVGQTLAPILWFLFCAWMMAVQYCDYAFDNHRISFTAMSTTLKKDRSCAMSFGVISALFSMIPIVNFIVMPVAICGATALWCDRYRPVPNG